MIYLIKRSLTSLRGFTTTFIRKPDLLIIKYQKSYTDPDGEQYTYTYNASNITLNYLKSRNDFKDYSSFGLYTRETVLENLNMITYLFETAETNKWATATLKEKLGNLFQNAINGYPYSATNLINMSATTLESRCDFRGIRTVVSGTRLLRFFVPFTNMNFTQMPIVVALCPGNDFVTSEQTEVISNDNEIIHDAMIPWMKEHSVMPSIRFVINGTPIKNNKSNDTFAIYNTTPLVVEVELIDAFTDNVLTGYDTEIYLEHVNGYVPYDRVRINPNTGRGEFVISSRDMLPNSTIKVKAGFRYYPGISEIIFKTVNE